jgi:solute carrier family 35 (UDP-sugar transporter), member A1/2/3
MGKMGLVGETNNGNFIKYFCLVLLVAQTTSIVIVMRYSRTVKTSEQVIYLSSTAVVSAEVMKLIACLFVVWMQADYSMTGTINQLNVEIFEKKVETLKLLIPAGLYTLQNNLLFVALSNLDVCYFLLLFPILLSSFFLIFGFI